MARMWDKNEDARALAEAGVEVWTPCHLAPNAYWVSNMGNVMSLFAGKQKQLQLTEMESGRHTVSVVIRPGERAVTHLVYRLVVHGFDGAPPTPDHTDVLHGLGGSQDNRLCNLRWGTRSENMRDVLVHKRQRVREREKTEPVRVHHKHEWHDGTASTDALIERLLKAYNAKKITVEGMASALGCTRAEAYGLVKGTTNTGHEVEGRAAENGRVGDQHYRAVCTDAELAEAFQRYTENHWSGVQFAEYLGIKQVTAHAILAGRNRTNVPRPEGFAYPWPDASSMNARRGESHGCAKLSDEQILAAFQRIEDGELTSILEIAHALNVGATTVYSIVNGVRWTHLPRSEKLIERVEKMQRTSLTPEQQQAVLADLLAGVPRNEVKAKYELSPSKIAAYITRANKMRQATDSGL